MCSNLTSILGLNFSTNKIKVGSLSLDSADRNNVQLAVETNFHFNFPQTFFFKWLMFSLKFYSSIFVCIKTAMLLYTEVDN